MKQNLFNLRDRVSYVQNEFDGYKLDINFFGGLSGEPPIFLLEYKEFLRRKRLYQYASDFCYRTYPYPVREHVGRTAPSPNAPLRCTGICIRVVQELL